MASQLNIKDPVLIERVRDLAKRSHKPVTATLRELVDREWEARELERTKRLARMRQWAAEVQAQVPPELKGLSSKEIMDSLYDDNELDGFAR